MRRQLCEFNAQVLLLHQRVVIVKVLRRLSPDQQPYGWIISLLTVLVAVLLTLHAWMGLLSLYYLQSAKRFCLSCIIDQISLLAYIWTSSVFDLCKNRLEKESVVYCILFSLFHVLENLLCRRYTRRDCDWLNGVCTHFHDLFWLCCIHTRSNFFLHTLLKTLITGTMLQRM